tara:strand:+ start:2673 stop:2864 length:192 start_codon:yes stop_codon:yes gene_type:complete
MKRDNDKIKIINEIEKVRKHNNVNWMNLMKIAFKYAPDKAKKCLKQIDKQDRQINKLMKKLIK